jgi:hypothetical protein
MPYLTSDEKDRLLDHMYPETAGELNFLITTMCRRYFSKSKRNYEAINTVLGALECAKQEYYRRIVVPYENSKINSNGDVYEGDLQ